MFTQLKDLGKYLYSTRNVSSFKKETFDRIIADMKKNSVVGSGKDVSKYNYNIFTVLNTVISDDITTKKIYFLKVVYLSPKILFSFNQLQFF